MKYFEDGPHRCFVSENETKQPAGGWIFPIRREKFMGGGGLVRRGLRPCSPQVELVRQAHDSFDERS
jgi:hypothetical protein